jgi:hypothetical protein
MKKALTCNPKGVAAVKPIALRLLKDEREEAEQLSGEKNISMSALAREAYLAGLSVIKSSMASTEPPLVGISSPGAENRADFLQHPTHV